MKKDSNNLDINSIDKSRRRISKIAWTTPVIMSVSLPAHAQTSGTPEPCSGIRISIPVATTFTCNTADLQSEIFYLIDDTDVCNPRLLSATTNGNIEVICFHLRGQGTSMIVYTNNRSIARASVAYENGCGADGTVTNPGGAISGTYTATPNGTVFDVSGTLRASVMDLTLSDLVLISR